MKKKVEVNRRHEEYLQKREKLDVLIKNQQKKKGKVDPELEQIEESLEGYELEDFTVGKQL